MPKMTSIKIGDRFGKLTIIEDDNKFIIENNNHKRKLFTVKCDCGTIFTTRIDYLSRGDSKQCKLCTSNQKTSVLIGDVYDKLTIKSFIKLKNKKRAVCECICGNIVIKRPELLTHINKTNNCGCLPRGGWTGVGKLATSIFNRYKRGAKVRNLIFEIDIKYAWSLYENQNGKCALTGLDISFAKLTINKNDASLDRIDSSKGYIKGNLQWVHKDINYIKMDINQDRFIELCKLVSEKNKSST